MYGCVYVHMYVYRCMCVWHELTHGRHASRPKIHEGNSKKTYVKRHVCHIKTYMYIHVCIYAYISSTRAEKDTYVKRHICHINTYIYIHICICIHLIHEGSSKKNPSTYSGIVFRLFAFFILLVCYGGFGVALYVSVYVCLILIVGYSS